MDARGHIYVSSTSHSLLEGPVKRYRKQTSSNLIEDRKTHAMSQSNAMFAELLEEK